MAARAVEALLDPSQPLQHVRAIALGQVRSTELVEEDCGDVLVVVVVCRGSSRTR